LVGTAAGHYLEHHDHTRNHLSRCICFSSRVGAVAFGGKASRSHRRWYVRAWGAGRGHTFGLAGFRRASDRSRACGYFIYDGRTNYRIVDAEVSTAPNISKRDLFKAMRRGTLSGKVFGMQSFAEILSGWS